MSSIRLVLASLLVLGAPLRAQHADTSLTRVIGAQMKVFTNASAAPYEGKLVRVFRDSVFIGGDSATTSGFALREVHIIEAAEGRHPTGRSVGVGALTGVLLGSAALFVHMSQCHGELCGLEILGLPIAGGGGLILGGALGAAVGETRWKRVWPL